MNADGFLLRDKYSVNKDNTGLLKRLTTFCLDLDGTLYLDETWIDGARDFLDALEAKGKRYCFLTNNSSKSAAVYVEKLRRMGMEIVARESLVTSGDAMAACLVREYPGKKAWLFGNEPLKEEFRKRGVLLTEEDSEAEVVVTAFHTGFCYDDLCRLCDLVRKGLPYLATHPDINCPVKTGFVPDIGALAAYVEASTGRRPDLVTGKPNGEIMEYSMRLLGGTRETTCMVGDRLYTDVQAGVDNGITGILVLSGEASLSDMEASDVMPDLIFDSVKEMIPFL